MPEQRPSQPGDADLYLRAGGRRWIVLPDRLNQPGYRYHLVGLQREDGAWHQYYLADSIEQDKLDANTVAYFAAGVWHRWLVTGDRAWVESMWGVVEKAIDFVLDLQTPRGEILWARHADGTPWSFALLTGSSSMCHSLRCAVAVAELLGHDRPDWELSAARLAQVIRAHCNGQAPDAFDEQTVALAGIYAAHAAQALRQVRTIAGLRRALESRHDIGIAQGVVAVRYEISYEEAFAVLQRYSNETNVKLRELARRVKADRALPPQPPPD